MAVFFVLIGKIGISSELAPINPARIYSGFCSVILPIYASLEILPIEALRMLTYLDLP